MKALVIGGTGYIGSHVVERLVALGFEVTVFARGKTISNVPDDVVRVQGDRHERRDLASLARRGFEAIVDVNAYKREETELAVGVFDGAVSRFVHISSISVNQMTTGFPLRESDPLVVDPALGYAYDKAECERALHKAHAKSDFPFVSIRPSVVFGPRDRISRENYYIKRLVAGEPVILPDGGLTPVFGIYVRDLADAVAQAIVAERAPGRCYHLMQRDRLSLAAHVATIARIAGREAETVAIPSRVLERVGFNMNSFPYYSGGSLLDLDTSSATRDLNFRLTPHERAVDVTVRWFLDRTPETLGSIEDRFAPVIPRDRQSAFARRYRDRLAALEDEIVAETSLVG